ncbi:ATP-binding protein [Vagococcus jeotgali]|uniref:ATP-binding protein n=1 Tax=Vagococcus jeotgali TaxID=3109030 RepID=UPI002DD86A9A|nr:AAA family ATPase [Vagococcus sp. B2T-5]
MKITRLYINGFGKFNNQVFHFSEGNQLVFGGNESGKSTLYQFIRTILFGFPRKREIIRDFTPVEGATYGGHLIIEHQTYGQVYVERFKEKNKGQALVRLEDGSTGEEALLKKIISPLTQEVFDQVFSFQEEQMLDLTELNEVRLQRVLLAVGLTGSDRLTKMSEDFIKERQRLFKASGRIPVLNQKLKEFNRLEQSIKVVEEQEFTYRNKQTRFMDLSRMLKEEREESEYLSSLEKTFLDQQKHFPLYVELTGLKRDVNESTQASEVTTRSVKDALQEYRFLMKKETELLEKQGDAGVDLTPGIQFYIDNQDVFDHILEDQVTVEATSERRDVLEDQLSVYRENKEELFEKYHLSNALLDVSITEQEETGMKELAEQEDELTRDRVLLANEKSRLSIKQSKLDDELTKSENQLALLDSDQPDESQKENNKQIDPFVVRMFSGLSIAISVLMLLLGIVLGQGIFYVLTVVLIGLGVFGFVTASKGKKSVTHNITPEATKEIYVQQLGESDAVANEWQAYEEGQAIFNEKNKLIQKQKEQWAIAYGFSMEETVSMWLTKLPVFSQLRDIQENEQKMMVSLSEIDRVLDSYQEMLSFAKDWIPLENKSVRESYQEVKQFVSAQKEAVAKLDGREATELQYELQSIRHQKDETLTLINQLIDYPKNTPIEEANQWLVQQTRYTDNHQRIQELESQLESYFDLNKTYQLMTINQELMRLKAQQEACSDKMMNYQMELQKLDYELKQMAKNGSLDELRQQRENQLALIKEMSEQWITVRLAEELTREVFQFLSDQQLPTLLSTVSNYFKLLTEDKYVQVLVRDGQLLVKDQSNRLWNTIQLSTGAKDQLYVAFRLGFIHLHHDDYKAPIIIDDGWLHFDEERKETLFKVLDVLSEKTQVLCMTSDMLMKEFYEHQGKQVLILGEEVQVR